MGPNDLFRLGPGELVDDCKAATRASRTSADALAKDDRLRLLGEPHADKRMANKALRSSERQRPRDRIVAKGLVGYAGGLMMKALARRPAR